MEFFGDNVKFEITTGIEDLKDVLQFMTKNEKDTCVGYRILEHPYTSGRNKEEPRKIPTLEVLRYESSSGEDNIQKFLSPLTPVQMHDQIKAWLVESMKDMPRNDDLFTDAINHQGFTMRAGWFDISMMKVKFQIWPDAIGYGK